MVTRALLLRQSHCQRFIRAIALSDAVDKLRQVKTPIDHVAISDFTHSLAAHLQAPLLAVDQRIKSALRSDVALVEQIAQYIVQAGGKRLRPALTILGYEACAGQTTPDNAGKATSVAAIVELIHTATLLHDDVVDDSSLRRGHATANAEFGNAASVLVGDFLYSRSFQLMVETGDMRVLRVLAEATNVIAEGEVHQLMNAGRLDLTEYEYLHVVRAKTAKLFEAAARLGAITAEADETTQQQLAMFGAHLGTAFQIADDVLDYEGDATTTGKNLGDDLVEGKLTLPIIRALQVGTPAQRTKIESAIRAHSHEQLQPVLSVLHETNAIAYARQAAIDEAIRAQTLLTTLPNSRPKTLLLNCCDFAVSRNR
jgi:octaprenyl-diphosphate synthase